MRVLVLHGPNMAALGSREPLVYGSVDLSALDEALAAEAEALGVEIECRQCDLEGEIIERIHAATDVDGIILNPAGYTHTSVAIRDAVAATDRPVIEVHLSNLHAREPFRRRSVIAGACAGQISGLGISSYVAALVVLARSRSGGAG
jgi:3-dehydroquinate dehydratase-2